MNPCQQHGKYDGWIDSPGIIVLTGRKVTTMLITNINALIIDIAACPPRIMQGSTSAALVRFRYRQCRGKDAVRIE